MSISDEDRTQDKHVIKPDNKKAKLDTSNWPLLLKVKLPLTSELRHFKYQDKPFHPYPMRIFTYE